MKVLQVSPYFHPYVGGQERYVRCLARALVDRGHTVEVFTSNFPNGKEYEVIDGIQVRRFNFLCRPLNNPITPMLLFSLIRHCKDFDIIHAHNEHAAVSQYCALAKSYSNVPLVVTCHGQLKFDHFAKDLIEHSYSKTLGAKLLKKADKVITISDSDKNYVHSLGVPLEKIRVIPNGVDLTRYNFQHIDPPKRMIFEGKQVVLFVGPLLKRKGPQVLIQTIPLIVKEHPDVVFVFVGGGNFKVEMEKLSRTLHVEKYTHFTGYIPENLLYNLYQRADVFVLPSFSEALSYTILDAFIFSKPVVSTLIPCIKDYLSGYALLVPPGDSEALAHAVVSLLSDKKLAKKLGEKGRRLVETCFKWDVIVEKILQIYHELLK
jgi:glycosyltransferase involved in cell wall biosynthesis